MRFESFEFDGKLVPFHAFEHLMTKVGFYRGGPWDWDRATYDFKFENQQDGSIYYLRFPVVTEEGEIEKYDTVVKLHTPYVGKHYYPHGIEYEDDFPEFVVQTCEDKLNETKRLLNDYLNATI